MHTLVAFALTGITFPRSRWLSDNNHNTLLNRATIFLYELSQSEYTCSKQSCWSYLDVKF